MLDSYRMNGAVFLLPKLKMPKSQTIWISLLGLLIVIHDVHTGDHPWSYEGQYGPEHWCHQFKACCGDSQSPIDIDTSTTMDEDIPPISFTNYDKKPLEMQLKNNGHSVYTVLNQTGFEPTIKSGGLSDSYEFLSLHWHWGSQADRGSEHTINGKHAPVELHLVHFNKKYETIQRALQNRDGLAVIGILYQISNEDNRALQEITSNLQHVKDEGAILDIDRADFNLMSLLPTDTTQFYRYTGSLTTPECNEIVTWTVMEKSAYISTNQLNELRALTFVPKDDQSPHSLVNNYRPTQNLKSRTILHTGKYGRDNSAGGPLANLSIVVGASLLVLVILHVQERSGY